MSASAASDRLLARLLGRWLGLRPPTHRTLVEHDLTATMRDGTVLRADRHHPIAARHAGETTDPAAPHPAEATDLAGLSGQARTDPAPLVLLRSPYGRGLPFRVVFGQLLAERGYQVVLQSCRGTGGSEGALDPFAEREDGHDTVAWLRGQPWYPGRFATAGPSYLATTQWALADAAPEELAAMVVVAGAASVQGAVHPGGGLALDTWLTWSARMVALARHHGARQPGAHHHGPRQRRGATRLTAAVGGRTRRTQALHHLPLREADAVATGGRSAPWWQEWLAEPEPDAPAWRRRDATAAVRRTRAAVALVSGWDDLFLPQQLADWETLHAPDAPAEAGPHRLVVGPWGHGALGLMTQGLRETVTWLDAMLLGHGSPPPTPVRYAVTEGRGGGRSRGRSGGRAPGRARGIALPPWARPSIARPRRSDAPRAVDRRAAWRDTISWPPPGMLPQAWHLQGPPAPGTEHRRGGLAPPPPLPAPPTLLHADPADPAPVRGGPSLDRARTRAAQGAVERREDVLTFTSRALCAPLEIAGPVTATLHVRADQPSVDVVVRVCDVDPNGRSVHVCEGLRRLDRADEAPRRAEVALWPTAHRFAAGHRVRLQVASAAFPRYARNPGTGEPLGEAEHARPTTLAVHHHPDHPSRVVLPVHPIERTTG